MVNKNLALASFAIVLAVGSATASTFVASDVWVKARLVENGPIRCIDTQKTCSNTGSGVCTIIVPTSVNSGTQTASSVGPNFPYSDSDCETVLFNNASLTQASTVQTYELVP
jgi:hypothetical protein